jgi:prefoldin beta subunit
MSEQELPPWVREQVSRLQQLQQNLQAIMMQKQQLEVELAETNTRVMVLGKQETRVKENLKEVENKINEMIRGMQAGGGSPSAGSSGSGGPRQLG